MKIFVINLKKDVEKREKVEAQLQALNLDYEIIEAVYGKDLSDEELEILVKDYKNSYLTKGEIGCVLSHQKIYKKMQEENIHHCLILEDDVIIKPESKEFLQEMDEFLANKKNFICLLYKAGEYAKNKKIILKGNMNFFEIRNIYRTHAYIITKDSAKTMLKINSPIILEADIWDAFQNLSFLKIYSLSKNLILSYDLNGEYSSIEELGDRKSNNLKRTAYRDKILQNNFSYRFHRRLFKIFKRPFLKLVKNSEEEMLKEDF